MDVKDVKKLLDAVAAAEVTELSYETGDVRITIRRGEAPVVGAGTEVAEAPPQRAAATPPAPRPTVAASADAEPSAEADAPTSSLVEVTAPIVGTFYDSPAPDAATYVKVGDHVAAGTVLCIIEAMKLMNEIEAETAGTVTEILVRNEEPVEYGQVLFRIDPD